MRGSRSLRSPLNGPRVILRTPAKNLTLITTKTQRRLLVGGMSFIIRVRGLAVILVEVIAVVVSILR